MNLRCVVCSLSMLAACVAGTVRPSAAAGPSTVTGTAGAGGVSSAPVGGTPTPHAIENARRAEIVSSRPQGPVAGSVPPPPPPPAVGPPPLGVVVVPRVVPAPVPPPPGGTPGPQPRGGGEPWRR